MRRVTPFWILLTTLLVACQAPEQEDALRLDRGDYNRAFQACIEAGREQDMSPALADRSNGIIETEPRLIGSLLEPWRTDTKGIDQTLQATLQMERRRVRFVFVPEGFEPQVIDGASDFQGAAAPGSSADLARFDLETFEGPIELRTRVFIERGFTPGIRQSTWSGTLRTVTTEPAPKQRNDGTTRSPTQWTPIGRDEAAERRLTARVAELLAESGATDAAVTSGQPADEPSS
jgi:hypothetical protein